MDATITLREYINKCKEFVIPNYQRGYVWGKNKIGGQKNAVKYILEDSLLPGYDSNSEVFLQGITVSERESEIILIDGQQRTTFFYLLLRYLGYNGEFKLRYDIRSESENALVSGSVFDDYSENLNEEYQDVYFFKKTIRIIHELIKEEMKEKFLTYLLDNVRFLYIDIPDEKQATTVFSMMNGNKAEMLAEELIKAEILRLASINEKGFDNKPLVELNKIEWDNNMLRSRYAREWDKWLRWWNQDDVRRLFKCKNIMGLLIASFQKKVGKPLTYHDFKTTFLGKSQSIEAKQTFDQLRRLQKRFEDAFNTPIVYNYVGAILRIGDAENFITWYFTSDNRPTIDQLKKYYKYTFIGVTHKEILEDDVEMIKKRFDDIYNVLSDDDLYNIDPENAFRLLLRLNIDEDNKLEEGRGRKFDFSIWDRKDSRGRSLEHIFPKSKVWHVESDSNGNIVIKNGAGNVINELMSNSDYLARGDCYYMEDDQKKMASEHSIGNLVLLYKDDNSSFKDSSFEEKKTLFFMIPSYNEQGEIEGKKVKNIFKSRHLLHTIFKFANSKWDGVKIAENKYKTLKDFRLYYGEQD